MILRARQAEDGHLRLLIPYPKERRKRVKIVIGEWGGEFKKQAKNSDILILAKPEDLKKSWKKGAFLIKGPGEYEVKGIFVTGIPDSGEAPLYVVDGEGNRSLYVHSFVKKELETETWERIGEIDILFAPLDKDDLPAPKKVKSIIAQVDPGVVVFFRKKAKGKKKVKDFLKDLDVKSYEEEEEVALNKSDISEDQRLYFVLSGGG